MATLVDTNVLLRSVQTSDPLHTVALHAVETLLSREEPLFLAVQNVAESGMSPLAQGLRTD